MARSPSPPSLEDASTCCTDVCSLSFAGSMPISRPASAAREGVGFETMVRMANPTNTRRPSSHRGDPGRHCCHTRRELSGALHPNLSFHLRNHARWASEAACLGGLGPHDDPEDADVVLGASLLQDMARVVTRVSAADGPTSIAGRILASFNQTRPAIRSPTVISFGEPRAVPMIPDTASSWPRLFAASRAGTAIPELIELIGGRPTRPRTAMPRHRRVRASAATAFGN
jgi:hypothetical protein